MNIIYKDKCINLQLISWPNYLFNISICPGLGLTMTPSTWYSIGFLHTFPPIGRHVLEMNAYLGLNNEAQIFFMELIILISNHQFFIYLYFTRKCLHSESNDFRMFAIKLFENT